MLFPFFYHFWNHCAALLVRQWAIAAFVRASSVTDWYAPNCNSGAVNSAAFCMLFSESLTGDEQIVFKRHSNASICLMLRQIKMARSPARSPREQTSPGRISCH